MEQFILLYVWNFRNEPYKEKPGVLQMEAQSFSECDQKFLSEVSKAHRPDHGIEFKLIQITVAS